MSHSPSKQLIIEEWIDGPQLSTESVIWDGDTALVAVADRNYDRLEQLDPFVVEDGGNTPSRFSPSIDFDIDRLLAQSCQALGLERGTVKGDIVLSRSGPVLIELAARLSGGYFCTHTIPSVYGVNLVEVAAEIALGRKPDFSTFTGTVRCHQGNRYLFARPGRVCRIRNLEKARSVPGVSLCELFVQEGSIVSEITDHTRRAGVVIAYGPSRAAAVKAAETAIDLIEVEIKA
jgi:biotin carboxylase